MKKLKSTELNTSNGCCILYELYLNNTAANKLMEEREGGRERGKKRRKERTKRKKEGKEEGDRNSW
jgi:hypothetical protein